MSEGIIATAGVSRAGGSPQVFGDGATGGRSHRVGWDHETLTGRAHGEAEVSGWGHLHV